MKKPVIGILGRVDKDRDEDQFFAAYEKARIAVIRAEGIPVLLLPVQTMKYYEYKNSEIPELTREEQDSLCRELDLCDGLLIPGGYRWYVNYDCFLAKEAIKRDMPILGICAGMQMLGTLFYEDRIIVKNQTKLDHHQRKVKRVHRVQITPKTKLSEIVKINNIKVNSLHQYHLKKAPGYIINAISEDGLIEGIELRDKSYVIGVQWHPDAMLDYEDSARAIIKSFIEEAVSYRERG